MSRIRPNDPLSYATPFSGDLHDGETLVWAGRPPQGLRFRAGDVGRAGAVTTAAMAGLIYVGWIAGLTAGGRLSGHLLALLLASPGIGILAFAAGLLIGRLLIEPWQRRRTWYGVSDRRVLIVTDWQTRNVVARDLRSLDSIDVRRHWDGTGTITFDCPVGAIELGLFGRGEDSRYAFDRTADVDAAESAIQAGRTAASSLGRERRGEAAGG